MSGEKGSNTRKIYIPLVNEGTSVLRPTQGITIDKNIFIVQETSDYDPDDETWLFPPGNMVECNEEVIEGERILVARKRGKDQWYHSHHSEKNS